MISTSLDTNCTSGMIAMLNAWKYYKTTNERRDETIMNDIILYNQFDCKVLYEILEYMRINMVGLLG